MFDAGTKSEQPNDRRLWIGNLDPRVTEYQLLKLVQKYGTIEKFDVLFHRSGPQVGQPRGYAFVTYLQKEDAEMAKSKLHNMYVGQRKMAVTWANSIGNEEPMKPQEPIVIPALAMAKPEQKTDRESQIQAIEAKLKLMEKKSNDELKINDTVATKSPVILPSNQQNKSSNPSLRSRLTDFRRLKPYSKNSKHRR